MRIHNPLNKILNNEIKVRMLRIFFCTNGEINGREMAKMAAVSPKTAYIVLRELAQEGILLMRQVGNTYFFAMSEEKMVVKDVLKPLFLAEDAVAQQLFDIIQTTIKKSLFKEDIMSVALFGSVHAKTELPGSDVDLLVVVKTADVKKKVEDLFFAIDQRVCAGWGNIISPYVNSLAEFRIKAQQGTGAVSEIIKSYQLIYGARLERLMR